jgi:hypothetical protein
MISDSQLLALYFKEETDWVTRELTNETTIMRGGGKHAFEIWSNIA